MVRRLSARCNTDYIIAQNFQGLAGLQESLKLASPQTRGLRSEYLGTVGGRRDWTEYPLPLAIGKRTLGAPLCGSPHARPPHFRGNE